MAFRNYAILLALVAGALSVPINVQDGDYKCAKTCTESLSDNAKFKYTTGQTYVYSYEGTTETKLQGTSSQTSSLTIHATAAISVHSTCELSLQLSDISLLENGATSSNSYEFGQKLQANKLRFAFQDGRVEDLCSANSDDERVLNVKRGILSAFQNSMENFGTESNVIEESRYCSYGPGYKPELIRPPIAPD